MLHRIANVRIWIKIFSEKKSSAIEYSRYCSHQEDILKCSNSFDKQADFFFKTSLCNQHLISYMKNYFCFFFFLFHNLDLVFKVEYICILNNLAPLWFWKVDIWSDVIWAYTYDSFRKWSYAKCTVYNTDDFENISECKFLKMCKEWQNYHF